MSSFLIYLGPSIYHISRDFSSVSKYWSIFPKFYLIGSVVTGIDEGAENGGFGKNIDTLEKVVAGGDKME